MDNLKNFDFFDYFKNNIKDYLISFGDPTGLVEIYKAFDAPLCDYTYDFVEKMKKRYEVITQIEFYKYYVYLFKDTYF